MQLISRLRGGKSMSKKSCDINTLKQMKIINCEQTSPDESVYVLSPYRLYNKIIDRIKGEGFSSIERVAPKDANVIIRVFQAINHEHMKYEYYSLYGAECYVNENGEWLTESGGKSFSIEYNANKIGVWLYPDEVARFNSPDFIDFYVLVS